MRLMIKYKTSCTVTESPVFPMLLKEYLTTKRSKRMNFQRNMKIIPEKFILIVCFSEFET